MSDPQDVISRIQTIARGLPGVKEAPDYMPESLNQFPFALSYYRQGNTTAMAGWRKGLHTFFMEVHIARQVLPAALRSAMPFYEKVIDALIDDPTLNGTVSTIIWPVNHTFGWLSYGGTDNAHIGWRFEITVKQEVNT